jgi:poly-gamma-glutamate synthesis protein (capsule biosynthesis protein)
VVLRQYKLELLSAAFILLLVFVLFLQRYSPAKKLPDVSRAGDRVVGEIENKVVSKEEQIITLIVTGDVMLGRMVNYQMIKNEDSHFPFRKAKEILESADMTYINLENPLVDPCPILSGGIVFCAPTSSVKALGFAGVDVVNLANNHTRNFGQGGYNSTVKYLEKESILFSDSDNLAEIVVGETKFGFLGFDLVSKNWSDEKVRVEIKDASEQVDVLVIGFHWGREYQKRSNATQQGFGHAAIDAGADLVIGHHPHVIQELEEYNGALIAYSLGNFVFDQQWSEATRKGVIGIFNFRGSQFYSYEFIPIYINSLSQPEVVTEFEKAERILALLRG